MKSRRNREVPSWWNDPKADRAIQKKVRRNNLLAIVILIIVLIAGTNIEGCSDAISHFINKF